MVGELGGGGNFPEDNRFGIMLLWLLEGFAASEVSTDDDLLCCCFSSPSSVFATGDDGRDCCCKGDVLPSASLKDIDDDVLIFSTVSDINICRYDFTNS